MADDGRCPVCRALRLPGDRLSYQAGQLLHMECYEATRRPPEEEGDEPSTETGA
ncbi:MAG TPA: hypothetical protein VFR64_06070 [Methylomirabilota bacterium]|nr:hypothetical protein [Methylomirabilota bacterium]